eukprot:3316402-Alexandrium_andersonii.AAC.1
MWVWPGWGPNEVLAFRALMEAEELSDLDARLVRLGTEGGVAFPWCMNLGEAAWKRALGGRGILLRARLAWQ